MNVPTTGGDVRVTPEAVALQVDIAGLGSRFIALMIDSFIQSVITIALVLAVGPGLSKLGVSDSVTLPLVIVVVSLMILGYFPLFEIVMHGRTFGKRAQRLRVVMADGQPARAGAIIIRNLVRIVDYLPTSYMIGALTILISKRSQRVGDMAAGTIVVRERKVALQGPPEIPEGQAGVAPIDATAVTERDYAAVRAFLQRRGTLDPVARRHLAERLAATLQQRVGNQLQPGEDPEAFVESVARSYRARFTAEEMK